MKLLVNGIQKEFADMLTIKTLLDNLYIKPETVAIELNLEIVHKKEYDKQILKDGDKIEIISFVGGG